MKKAILITAIVALVAGAAGGVWLKTYLDNQAAAAAAEAKPEPSKYDVGPPDPQEMLELTNGERRKAGLSPLVLDPRLNASAQEKANNMRDHDYYGHDAPDGTTGPSIVFKYTGKECQYAGENLHSLLAATSNSRRAIDMWMSSVKGHREAIIDPKYNLVGFGVAKAKRGDSLVVQHFCQLR